MTGSPPITAHLAHGYLGAQQVAAVQGPVAVVPHVEGEEPVVWKYGYWRYCYQLYCNYEGMCYSS